jgi:hypothetical protein
MNVSAEVVQGVTFATDEGKIYVPLGELEQRLHFQIEDKDKRMLLRKLSDGTLLMSLEEIAGKGLVVERDESGSNRKIVVGKTDLAIVVGEKRVEVGLAEQRLRAWQGELLVLETRISSGRNGRTPKGRFCAGPYKAKMHYSKLYDNAPMPWSVQVNGNVFIHGFNSVPSYPASHGCIRMPLDGENPAKFFYEWIDVGTPVIIRD